MSAPVLARATCTRIQNALLALGGPSAQFGTQISSHSGERFYHASIRLDNGNLAYGDGATFEEALRRALTDPPIAAVQSLSDSEVVS